MERVSIMLSEGKYRQVMRRAFEDELEKISTAYKPINPDDTRGINVREDTPKVTTAKWSNLDFSGKGRAHKAWEGLTFGTMGYKDKDSTIADVKFDTPQIFKRAADAGWIPSRKNIYESYQNYQYPQTTGAPAATGGTTALHYDFTKSPKESDHWREGSPTQKAFMADLGTIFSKVKSGDKDARRVLGLGDTRVPERAAPTSEQGTAGLRGDKIERNLWNVILANEGARLGLGAAKYVASKVGAPGALAAAAAMSETPWGKALGFGSRALGAVGFGLLAKDLLAATFKFSTGGYEPPGGSRPTRRGGGMQRLQ